MVAIVSVCLPVFAETPQYSKYGGWTDLKSTATGFFHTKKLNGVWWLIDPDGNAFISKGVNHISFTADRAPSLGYAPYEQVTKEKYGDIHTWAEASIQRLRTWNFNTVGAWSNSEAFGKGMPYTMILDIGASAGSSWLKGSFFDVFSQEFRDVAERKARGLSQVADDPFLIGYFLDNELRWDGTGARQKLFSTTSCQCPKILLAKKAL